MKQNLTLLQSAVRHLRQSTTLNVKARIHQRLQHHAASSSCSAYQQFDVAPIVSNRHSRQQPQQQLLQLPTRNVLQKIVHKFLEHLHSNTNGRRQLRAFSSQQSLSVSKCWSCSVPQSGAKNRLIDVNVFCVECGIIQDLPEGSADEYFSLFGLERAFALNAVELTRKFRQLQGLVHPDKFSNRSDREQQLSADWSSLVNNAYKTLLAPIKRGEYLLRQHGMVIPEGNTAVGNAFLMEMMERNEEVDDAHSADELHALLHRVQDDLRDVVAKLDARLLDSQLDKALEELITLRYLVSLESSIKAKCTRLGIVAS